MKIDSWAVFSSEFDVRDVKKEPTHPKIEVDRPELLSREAGSKGYCTQIFAAP
jgi:hypothetical protein